MTEFIHEIKTYLDTNKAWIFSGIGVVVIGALVAGMRRLIFGETRPPYRSFYKNESGSNNQYRSGTESALPLDNELPLAISDQSAAFCYKRDENGTLLVLLVKTSTRLKWTFPKSENVEDQKDHVTANISARDEGGVSGDIEVEPFEQYLHFKQELKIEGSEKLIDIFFLNVHEETKPNELYRGPKWFELDDAITALSVGRSGKYALELKRVVNRAEALLTR